MRYRNQSIIVYGFGKSGVSTARYLLSQGAHVHIVDEKPMHLFQAHLETLTHDDPQKLNYSFGNPCDSALFESADLIVVSPGIPNENPLLRRARENGVDLVNEPELAFREIRAPVIAITGTNGKTTTTSLIGEILRASGRSVFVGGNIGTPLLDLVHSQRTVDYVVAELSSYQLELVRSLVPRVAVFTNISQNHLDRYGEMSAYVGAKHRLREMATQETTVVLNSDNSWLQSFRSGPAREVLNFSTHGTVGQGARWDEQKNTIHISLSARSFQFDMREARIPGVHNIENFMAAFCATLSVGVDENACARVVREFAGVPHRIEFVRTRNGVRFYNDSKSTTVESLITCLNAFSPGSCVLIMGGKDKGSDFTPLLAHLNSKCRVVCVYGAAREKIVKTFSARLENPIKSFDTFESAIQFAADAARPGENVILSPACASQDLFRDFEHRGDVFREFVLTLP